VPASSRPPGPTATISPCDGFSLCALRAGKIIFGVGSHEGTPLAAFGIVALASGAWRSNRGGTIDHFIRLDLALNPVAEGGALIDAQGRVLGMTVLGPRRRALAIPTSTIERADGRCVNQKPARSQESESAGEGQMGVCLG
jgi:S1-C subfamily serine protease